MVAKTLYLFAGDTVQPVITGVMTLAEKGHLLLCARCGMCTVVNAV